MSCLKHVPDLLLPPAPHSINKGSSLTALLDRESVICLAHNIACVYDRFPANEFIQAALTGLQPLSIMQRGHHIAGALKGHLPPSFELAVNILLESLTPPLQKTENFGMAGFFYLPHVCFVGNYGQDNNYNSGKDPFEISMNAQYELTQRFTAEFSIRHFINQQPERSLAYLQKWVRDPSPHVRRLCSEGTRPRLPWAIQIPTLIKDPTPSLAILEALKDDHILYVRRSVANHLGDIAKDHLEFTLDLGQQWLVDAPPERRWVIRHALRYPAKKGHLGAQSLRQLVAK